jgi:hypothetical protein
MSPRQLLSPVLLTLGGLLSAAAPVVAGFPWFQPRPSGHAAYAPQTQQYVVVTPTPTTLSPCNEPRWEETPLPAPAYPWGWFGARGSPQPWTHTRFYQGQRDHALIREQ